MIARRGSGWLARAAARAEVPVFLARGIGAAGVDALLRSSPRVVLLDSPRAATVLVVAGEIPAEHADALARVHDQMAHPRTTLWLTGDARGSAAGPPGWEQATILGADADMVTAVLDGHRELVTGARPSEDALLPDVDPVPWRGVGPYGHGGKGMTGGTPFGRPMAGRGDDVRDGLSLDVVPLRIGPFFPLFPAGLVVAATFAGDVVNDIVIELPRSDGDVLGAALPDEAAVPFVTVASGPVRVTDLERARARHHLRWLARIAHLYGLGALARRISVLDVGSRIDSADLARLARRLERAWVLGRPTAGVGRMNRAEAAAWGGPVARAAGIETDARTGSPAYESLGFEPVVHSGGDNRDRWRQRLAESVQAIELARRAESAGLRIEPGEPIEPPAPPPPQDAAARLAALLVGQEWGDAVAILASVDPGVRDRSGVLA